MNPWRCLGCLLCAASAAVALYVGARFLGWMLVHANSGAVPS